MRLYGDTSWWLGFKCRCDTHHDQAISIFEREPEAQVLWTPWHRVEVFNSFCQAERTGLVGKGESRRLIRLVEQEVRLGYWPHAGFSWVDAVRTASEIRAEHSLKMIVRSMDLFHVAIAVEVAADALLSFDEDQIALAAAAGLPALNLTRKHR